jgi:hypothetical protein
MAGPSTTDIMNAIAALTSHVDDRINDLRNELGGRIDDLKEEFNGLKKEFNGLRSDFIAFKMEDRSEFKVVHARLDEQRQTVNALIPTRIAAVPPAA